MTKSEKGDNSVKYLDWINIKRILPKVNQDIYTLDAICEPNTMTIEIIQSNISRILPKVNLWAKYHDHRDNSFKYLENFAKG